MTADLLGTSPQNVLRVGISDKCYEPGHPLSAAVRHSVQPAIDAILHELQHPGFTFRKKISPDEPAVCGAITNIRFHSKRADKQRASAWSISIAKTRPSMYLIGKQLSRTRPICTGIQRSMSESAVRDWTGDAQGLKLGTRQ